MYVRELQDGGAPIHITYPASVIGPDDPALTEPHQGLITYLANTVPVLPSGNQWVDVRDIAEAHRQLLERTLAPGRYTLGGHFVPWTELRKQMSSYLRLRIGKEKRHLNSRTSPNGAGCLACSSMAVMIRRRQESPMV